MCEERKHTPLPWYEAGRCTNAAMIASENDPKGLDIALVYDHCDGYEANIELVVRACNSHYELLAGCKLLIAWGEEVRRACGEIIPWPNGIEDIRAAIAKAQTPPLDPPLA